MNVFRQILQQLLVVRARRARRAQQGDAARRGAEADTQPHTAAQLPRLPCQDQPGGRAGDAGQRRGGAGHGRAVQRRRAHEALHADLRARRADAQEVLRAQRHIPLPGIPLHTTTNSAYFI